MRICLAVFGYAGLEGETVDALIGELQLALVKNIPVYYTLFGMAWTTNVHGPGPYQTPLTHILSWNINDWDMG